MVSYTTQSHNTLEIKNDTTPATIPHRISRKKCLPRQTREVQMENHQIVTATKVHIPHNPSTNALNENINRINVDLEAWPLGKLYLSGPCSTSQNDKCLSTEWIGLKWRSNDSKKKVSFLGRFLLQLNTGIFLYTYLFHINLREPTSSTSMKKQQ